MLEQPIRNMFDCEGKTVKIIGKSRVKTYQELYDYIEDLQKNKELGCHDNYLGDNVLARNIYEKKYYLKDIDANLIEKCPEDVFKRISSFLSTVEGPKAKQKQWAQKFYEQLFEGFFIPGGRVMAGAGDLYRLKTLANCFVTKIERDDINSTDGELCHNKKAPDSPLRRS